MKNNQESEVIPLDEGDGEGRRFIIVSCRFQEVSNAAVPYDVNTLYKTCLYRRRKAGGVPLMLEGNVYP